MIPVQVNHSSFKFTEEVEVFPLKCSLFFRFIALIKFLNYFNKSNIIINTVFKCININAFDIKDSDIICNLDFIYFVYDI